MFKKRFDERKEQKMSTMTETVKETLKQYPDKSAEEIANLGCSRSLVQKVRRRWSHKTYPTSQAKETKTGASSPECPLSLSLRIPSIGGKAEIKIRNSSGSLQGTLILCEDGLVYRRPNQKTSPEDRLLRWDTLDKLMQSGLL